MKDEVLIKVEGISKKFCKDLNLGLLYGLQDLGSGMFGKTKPRTLREKEFWAVDEISFEVKRGECLGLLGHNGAGKSTLLKVLTGLISPDKGKITMKGRVNALIELTAGFNPILTGRENIYNNGAVLGLSEKEINAKYDEIVAFSELEEFIDTPVQYYSSGMKVRLGFSVAAFTEPDVLILDEVLAVGDAGFRAKSFNKMKEIMKNAAVIFVSHSMPDITRTCSEVLFMSKGQSFYKGKNIHKGVEFYFNEFNKDTNSGNVENDNGAIISDFKINGNQIESNSSSVDIEFGKDLKLNFNVDILDEEAEKYFIEIQIVDKDLKMIAVFYSNYNKKYYQRNQRNVEIVFKNLNLINGGYSITYSVITHFENARDYRILALYRTYTKFRSVGLDVNTYASFYLNGYSNC